MDLRKIYEALGSKSSLDGEIKKFNNRLISILIGLDSELMHPQGYDNALLDEVVYNVGLNPSLHNKLRTLVRENIEDFEDNLHVAQITLETLAGLGSKAFVFADKKKLFVFLKVRLIDILNTLPLVNIGYEFDGNIIVKTGAKELDEKLISENLEWLKPYPDAKERFSDSLKHYLRKSYPDAITNAYSALEGLVKVFLDTKKRLDDPKTKKDLLGKLNLESYWSNILNNYCDIAHEFSSRHGKKKQESTPKLSPELVEFYVYMTGVFIRLISQRMSAG